MVLTFCFQFPLPEIQAILEFKLNQSNSCVTNCKKLCYCRVKSIIPKNRFLIFVFMKNKIANRPKIPVMEGEGKTESGATANKMAVALKWRSVPNLVPRVSSLSRRPWGRGWEHSFTSRRPPSCLQSRHFRFYPPLP